MYAIVNKGSSYRESPIVFTPEEQAKFAARRQAKK